jgi:tripartite-type tricarboxylate transporter receptor subunit TctC
MQRTALRVLTVSLALLAAAIPRIATAQGYPVKPIRMIVPTLPGGSGDVLSRPVAQKMSERLGQPVVVDYKPGAGMNIGMDAIAKAAPDGYTFGLVAPTLVTNPNLYAKLPFDPIKDLAPVTLAVYSYYVLVVNPSLPITNIRELMAYAKTNPGKLSFGSWGDGSHAHLLGELLKQIGSIDMVHIPYKGSAPAMQDVIGGQISFMFDPLVTGGPQARAGKVRAIGVAAGKRNPTIPDVPPINDLLPGFDYSGWLGFVAPAGIPRDVFQKLVDEVRAAVNAPDVSKRLNDIGYEAAASTPEFFADVVKSELAKYGKIIREAGIKLQ